MVLRLDQARNKTTVEEADWTEAAPKRLEMKILSIVCGNTSLHWALHNGVQDQFSPVLFWRTPPISDDELNEDSASGVLGRFLPLQAHGIIFGESNLPTKENATLASHRRKVPALTIYVLSTNGGNEKSVGFLFSELPHRMYRIESTDFFTKEQGCYDTFGVDRAASLYSAYACDQHPALVMDGGTAWTYTGIDANGKIMGGGISPGLGARFRSLSDYCGKLPSIDFNVYDKVFKHVFEQKKPLPVFATETQTAMITSVFQEVTVQCRQLVCQFLKEIEQTPKQNGETAAATATDAPSADAMPTEPKKPTIFVTGGDSAFLLHALQSDTAIVPEVPGFTFPKDKFEVLPNKHLIHYGVGRLLKNKFGDMDPMDPENGLRFRLVGQRVAKEFLLPDTDGEFLYRGSIISVKPGKTLDDDIYLIRYDDGDQEHLELTEVHDALKLYVEIGEKASADTVVWTEELRKEKKEESTKVMEDLKEQNEVVKAHAEKVEKAKAEAAAAAAAEAAKAPPPGETPDGVSPTREVKPKRVSSATRKVGRKPKRAKVSPEVEDRTKMYLKRRVAKNFPQENEQGELEDVLFFGTVMNISKSGYWHVVYDDDDEEDFDEMEMKTAILLYDEHKSKDKNAPPEPGNKFEQVEAVNGNLTTTSAEEPMEITTEEVPDATPVEETTTAVTE